MTKRIAVFVNLLIIFFPAFACASNPIDYSDRQRFGIVVGEVVSASPTGRYRDDIITEQEVYLTVIYQEKNSEGNNIQYNEKIVRWVHELSDANSLIHRKVILIFDKSNKQEIVNYVISTPVYCINSKDYVDQGWENLADSQLNENCFEYYGN